MKQERSITTDRSQSLIVSATNYFTDILPKDSGKTRHFICTGLNLSNAKNKTFFIWIYHTLDGMLKSLVHFVYNYSLWQSHCRVFVWTKYIPGGPKKGTVDFLGLCSDQQLSFLTLLDRASFRHYNNTKIIKFSWELFILWVISHWLSFSGFAINLSLIELRNSGNRANPENYSP